MTPLALAFLLVGLPPLAVLLLALLNALKTWPRGLTQARIPGRLSVLIPTTPAVQAVDLERCVRALFANDHPVEEVLIQYAHSNRHLLESQLSPLCREFPQVRLIAATEEVASPSCDGLVAQANGEVVLLLDANVHLDKVGLARIGSLFLRHEADLVGLCTAEPQEGFLARLLLPFRVLFAVAVMPLTVSRPGRLGRWLSAPCSQVIAARREALAAGHSALREPGWPDLETWAQAAKAQERRVLLADGHLVARRQPDAMTGQSLRRLEAGLAEATGKQPACLAALALFAAWCFLVPYVLLALALLPGTAVDPAWALMPALVGVAANVLLRMLGTLRYGHAAEGLLLHPLGALLLVAALGKAAVFASKTKAASAFASGFKHPLRPPAGRASHHGT